MATVQSVVNRKALHLIGGHTPASLLCCVLAQAEQHESKLNQMPRLWLETIGLESYSLSDDLISFSKFAILFKFDSQFAPHSNGLGIKSWCVLICHAILYQLCILT